MSKEFKKLLEQFSEKIEVAQTRPVFTMDELKDLDGILDQWLKTAETEYPQETNQLLADFGILESLEEMRNVVDSHLGFISKYALLHDEQMLRVNYHGRQTEFPLVDLKKGVELYFPKAHGRTEFYFITAYLAKNDRYDLLQIYHFLRSKEH